MKNRTRKTSRREAKLAVVEGGNASSALRACFAEQEEVLQPLLELVANARASINELMSEAARGLIAHRQRCPRLLSDHSKGGLNAALDPRASGSTHTPRIQLGLTPAEPDRGIARRTAYCIKLCTA